MSNQSNFCMIYYYVPEDHDDPEVPNAFGFLFLYIFIIYILYIIFLNNKNKIK